jgi:hypothetical protein
LAVSQEEIGEVPYVAGKLPAALDSFRAHDHRPPRQGHITNDVWLHELGVSNELIGDRMDAGNFGRGLTSYETKQTILVRLAKPMPTNAGWLRDLLASHGNIANLLRAQGKPPVARTFLPGGVRHSDHLAEADPRKCPMATQAA